MQPVPAIFFAASALCGAIGMGLDMQMSVMQDFIFAPAHAHLNLGGFLTLAVYGAFYALHRTAAETRLARLHCALAIAGVAIFAPGVALAVAGLGGTVATIGGALVLVSMLIFLGTAVAGLIPKRPYGQTIAA